MEAETSTRPNQNPAGECPPKPPLRASLGPGQLLWIALAGAGVLLGVQSVLMGVFGHESVWKTSWVVGAIFMGREVIHWPAVFDLAPITAAMTALYPTALVCALVLYGLTHRLPLNGAILTGVLVGALCYWADLYSLTPRYPWLAAERTWTTLVSYLVFGAVTAWLLRRANEELA